jgi:glycerol uptake facilitator protein
MAALARGFSPMVRWRRTAVGEYGSEYIGTFILIMFGDGVVAMLVAALNQSGRAPAPPLASTQAFAGAGDWLLIAWGWGMGVALAIYVAGGISGAHINPAVTLSLAAWGKFEWRKVPGYMVAQVLGAFTAAALVYLIYKNSINSFEAATHITRGSANSIPTYSIFATFPSPVFHNPAGAFLTELVGTALLVGIVFALIDEFNQPPGSNLAPFIVGLVVFGIGMSFGANSGYAINPARDLGPRLFAWIQGWGKIAVPGDYGWVNSYMWVPIVAPLVGGLIGATVYQFFIGSVTEARSEEMEAPELGEVRPETSGYVAPEADKPERE